MNWLKSGGYYIIIIIIISIFAGYFYLEKENIRWNYIYYKSIPHIDLAYTLYNENNIQQGQIRGFVLFDNKNDQPKDNTRQYYIIEPLNKFNDDMNQIFSIENIIVLNTLPPKSIEKIEIPGIIDSNGNIILTDQSGNIYIINTFKKQVILKDATGDSSELIVSNSQYENFMKNFLNKN